MILDTHLRESVGRKRLKLRANKDRQIKELHVAFELTFTSANGREPTIADLWQPSDVRARRDRERDLFQAHG